MRILVAIAEDVFDTGLAALLDTFETANELAGEARFVVSVVSPRGGVRSHHGFAIPTQRPPARAPDLVIVPALACKRPDTIIAALDRPDVRRLIDVVAGYAKRCRVAAACTGTFVLGRAGVLDGKREGRVLITQRRADQALPLQWEFPGGKVEAGEAPVTALARELAEEIGVRVEVGRVWDVLFHVYEAFDLVMLVYTCRIVEGEARAVEVADLAWALPDELPRWDILPADRPLVDRLVSEGPPSLK